MFCSMELLTLIRLRPASTNPVASSTKTQMRARHKSCRTDGNAYGRIDRSLGMAKVQRERLGMATLLQHWTGMATGHQMTMTEVVLLSRHATKSGQRCSMVSFLKCGCEASEAPSIVLRGCHKVVPALSGSNAFWRFPWPHVVGAAVANLVGT